MLSVAFQGEHGAYSEQAIKGFYADQAVKTIPCESFTDAIEQVTHRHADYAMIPVENSLAGTVVPAYDAIMASHLRIQQQVVLRVEHCLMALPSTPLESVRIVRSHPQALSQCAERIKRLKISPQAAYDTAGAAKHLALTQATDEAVIASQLAAETYGLEVLQSSFEDESFNFTRFFLLGREPLVTQSQGLYLSSLIFATLDQPNALVRVLSIFAKHNINLKKIESRPSRNRAWDYIFMVDFEGADSDLHVQQALLEILQATAYMKNLGSYRSVNI